MSRLALLRELNGTPSRADKQQHNVIHLPSGTQDTAYGLAALTGMCDAMVEAGIAGGRDNTLNNLCMRAGVLIRDGDLTRATAESALRQAAYSVTDLDDFTTSKVDEKLDRVIDQGEASAYQITRTPLDPIPGLREFLPQAPAETDGAGESHPDFAQPAQNGEAAPEAEVDLYALRVNAALADLRIKHDAQTLHRAELAARTFREPPYRSSLTAELLMPDEPVQYAITDLLPIGGNALLAAQYKTGKTTVVGDLARAYADGTPFLGQFHVEPGPGRFAIWNYELSETQYRRWLRDLGIVNTDRVVVLHLRGYRLPITSPPVEDWIVRWLAEHDVSFWVPDPFARAAVGTDENSNTEVGVWLDTLDVIKERAGVRDLVLPTHTGRAEQEQGQERARGATRLDDWADVRWLLTKDKDDNRFFRATGRDVEQPEELLAYDESSRRLSYGGGDRQWVAKRDRAQRVLDFVNANPGCVTREVAGMGGNKEANQAALVDLIRRHKVRAEDISVGRTSAVRHFANEVTA